MDDKDSNSTSTTNNESTTTTTTAIAMKLLKNFLPLNLNSTPTNEIIHSPLSENEFEYKKELSVDIMDKYGGQQSKSKQFSNHGKKHKKNKKVRSFILFLFILISIDCRILPLLIIHK